MKEINIQQLVRIEASKYGCILWRNNQGKFQDKTGRWVTYGVGVGGADLIGLWNGRFVGFEIKVEGKKATPEQQKFIDLVNKNGGIAGVLTSPDDVKLFLK